MIAPASLRAGKCKEEKYEIEMNDFARKLLTDSGKGNIEPISRGVQYNDPAGRFHKPDKSKLLHRTVENRVLQYS